MADRVIVSDAVLRMFEQDDRLNLLLISIDKIEEAAVNEIVSRGEEKTNRDAQAVVTSGERLWRARLEKRHSVDKPNAERVLTRIIPETGAYLEHIAALDASMRQCAMDLLGNVMIYSRHALPPLFALYGVAKDVRGILENWGQIPIQRKKGTPESPQI